MRKISACFVIACALMACNNPSTSTNTSSGTTNTAASFDMGKARAAIDSANAQFQDAVKRGDSAAMAALYTSDAVVMPPDMEAVTSTNDLPKLWGGFIRMGVKELKLSTTDLKGDSDFLVETGTFEVYVDNNKKVDNGKYMVVWKPENGTWKLYRDIWNSNNPPTPMK